MLNPSRSTSISDKENEREAHIRDYILGLAQSLREALRAIPKSPTMMRLAAVLESFSNLPVSTPAQPIATTAEQLGAAPIIPSAQDTRPANNNTDFDPPLAQSFRLPSYEMVTQNGGFNAALQQSTQSVVDFQAPDAHFDELPQVPPSFNLPTFEGDFEMGWMQFESLLNGNIFPTTTF